MGNCNGKSYFVLKRLCLWKNKTTITQTIYKFYKQINQSIPLHRLPIKGIIFQTITYNFTIFLVYLLWWI